MKILAIEHTVPETVLTNDEAIDRVRTASRQSLTNGELDKVASHLRKLFESTGLETRHITDGKDRPIELIADAAERAVESAGIAPNDLDLIIYGGVTKGFLVPSTASTIQHALGAKGASCFDVSDACASWARGLQVAQSLIANGSAETALIVNCECGIYENCDPWSIRSMDDLEVEAGAFTLGEAATATVIERGDESYEPEFHSRTYGEFGDLATLPLAPGNRYFNFERPLSTPMRFHTRTAELTLIGFRLGMDYFKEIDPLKGQTVDAFVPHAGAAPSIDMFMKVSGLQARKLIMSFREYGNTVSASIPLGLSLAARDGRLERGDSVFAASVAGGISIVAVLFTY